MPKVSVIIPTYNRPDFLRLAITSVLNQTFKDLEILVVDDASRGYRVKEIVYDFRDERIRYIRHVDNKGLSASRNTGIKASVGKYIALLDDDDEWFPLKLEKQFDLLEKSLPKVGVVYTGSLKIDKTSDKVFGIEIPTKRGNIFDDLIKSDCVIAGGSSTLIRRECFEKVGFFDDSVVAWEAYDMWIRISRVFDFEYVEQPLIKHNHHAMRITTNFGQLIKGIESILERYGHLFSLNKKSYSQRICTLGTLYCLSGNTKKGRELLIKATRLYPYEVRNYYNLFCSMLGTFGFKKLNKTKKKVLSPFRARDFTFIKKLN